MSYATELFTSITFLRKTFNNLFEVREELEETERLIKNYENRLYSLGMMTEPKKFCDEEDDPLAYIVSEVKDSLSELQELYVESYKLTLVIETWDKSHDSDGNAIALPKSIPCDAAYIEGDYINHK